VLLREVWRMLEKTRRQGRREVTNSTDREPGKNNVIKSLLDNRQ